MPKGGKRKGAGRRKGKPTVRITIPRFILNEVRDFIQKLLKKE